jgi:hypothetical protein
VPSCASTPHNPESAGGAHPAVTQAVDGGNRAH